MHFYVGQGPSFVYKYYSRPKKLTREKHSSLLGLFVSDEEKKSIFNFDTWIPPISDAVDDFLLKYSRRWCHLFIFVNYYYFFALQLKLEVT